MFDTQSSQQIFLHQKNTDILLLFLNNYEQGVLTGKLFDYMYAQRPIFCVGKFDPFLKDLFSPSESVYFAKNESETIVQIEKWLTEKQLNQEIPASFSPETISKFTRKKQVEQLSNKMLELLC